jgi:hypothetical protein
MAKVPFVTDNGPHSIIKFPLNLILNHFDDRSSVSYFPYHEKYDSESESDIYVLRATLDQTVLFVDLYLYSWGY